MNEKEYKDLFDSLKQIKDNERYLDEFVNLVSKILYSRSSFVKNSDNDFLRKDFYKNLRNKLSNISEKIGNLEIDFIGCGHSSLVFKIGDEVLKIGKVSSNFKKSKPLKFKCLIPVFYSDCFEVSDNEFYTIQISPFVEVGEFSDEDVYFAYKALRKEGYIWNDPTKENIGRIIRDVETDSFSYKAGDIVIIDLEDLAYVGEDIPDYILDEIAFSSYNKNVYAFEMRYISEKANQMK